MDAAGVLGVHVNLVQLEEEVEADKVAGAGGSSGKMKRSPATATIVGTKIWIKDIFF